MSEVARLFCGGQKKCSENLGGKIEDDAALFGLEPLHGLLLHQSVRESNGSDLSASVSDVHASPAQDDVEVHTVDADGGIVLDAQVNVFLDAETEVAVVREILATQFVFTDLCANKPNH